MSVFVRPTSARFQRHPSHVDPYQLYELRRPHERASTVVPQLPRQPDFAHTRLRYRRIIFPPNTHSSSSPSHRVSPHFPPAFRPVRAASFGSSELSASFASSRARKPLHASVRGDAAAMGKFRRCFQRVHRSHPFRRSFRRTAQMEEASVNKGPEVSSDFDISSDEEEGWDEYDESRRRNSLHLPSSSEDMEQEDDKLARFNTAPVVIQSLCIPRQMSCVSPLQSNCEGSVLVSVHDKRDAPVHQRVSAPPKSSFHPAPKARSDRLHRAYSAHIPNNERHDYPLKPSATTGRQTLPHRFDHQEALLKHSRTFHASDLDRGDLSVSFVLLEHKKKRPRSLVQKFLHAFHLVRVRTA